MQFNFSLFQKSNIRCSSTSSKAVISRSSVSQQNLEQYMNVSQSNSIKSPSDFDNNYNNSITEQAILEINKGNINLDSQEKPRGIKRKIEESSSDIIDSGPSSKKHLMSNDGEQLVNDSSTSKLNATQNWVKDISQTEQLTPEQSTIPTTYKEEVVGICKDHEGWVEYVIKTHAEAKVEAYRLIDDVSITSELLQDYAKEIFIRVRERIPTKFSRDVDYDSTFDSDSENGNELPDLGRESLTGLMEPRLSPDNQGNSNSEDEDEALSETSSEESDHIDVGNSEPGSSVSGDSSSSSGLESLVERFFSNRGVTVNDPVLDAEYPEMAVHHSSSSNDAIAEGNVSTDSAVSDPFQGSGLVDLNNGLGLQEVTYSGLYREDQHSISNYLINTRGTDDLDYRSAFEYIVDAITNLDLLIVKYELAAQMEGVLRHMVPNFSDYTSGDIFDAANGLLTTLSGMC